MPTTAFFNTIKTQLLAIVYDGSNIPYVDMWNNQLDGILSGGTYSSSLPALFIEFLSLNTDQLGNGNQIYPELIVRIHMLNQQVDAGDGTMELDLTVLDLRDAVHLALQNFRPTGASEFIRQKQEMDYTHNNVYHYIMDYGCTFIDTLTGQPVNGVVDNGPITPQITISN